MVSSTANHRNLMHVAVIKCHVVLNKYLSVLISIYTIYIHNDMTNSTSFQFHQKSMTLPLRSQSPYLVGSGPLGPPISPVEGFVFSGNGS